MMTTLKPVLLFVLLAILLTGLTQAATAQGGGDPSASLTTSSVANPVVLTDERGEYPLGLYLEILEDASTQLTIEQVCSPEYSAQFVPNQETTPNLGYTDSAFWVRFGARNETAETHDWRLELGFANMQHVALYAPLAQPGSSEPAFTVVQTGTYYPFSTRDVAFHRFVFKLSLPVQAEETFYLRFQNDASMTLPLTLWSSEAFSGASRSEEFIWGIFYGVLLIILGHNALVFLSLRDRNYLYYSLFLGAFLLFQAAFAGHAQQYLWPNLVAWNRFAVLFFASALSMTALLFTASFLELRARAPRLGLALVVVLAVFGLVLLLSPFVSYGLLIRPFVILVIGAFLLMLVSGFTLWWRGYRPARFYVLSWTAFLMSIIALGLARYGVTPSTALTEQSYLVGTVLTVLLMTLALTDRIKLLQAETAQADRELRESESRLHQYLEAMPVGVTVRDADGRLRYVNRRARQLRDWPDELQSWEGSPRENIEDVPLYLRGTQQVYPLERLPAVRALQGESSAVNDVEIALADRRIPLEIRSSPVFDEHGTLQYAVSAFQDITERIQAEARIRDQLAVADMLAFISSQFVHSNVLDATIQESLQAVGMLLEFERLFLVRLGRDQAQMDVTAEWCAPGVPSLRWDSQGIPYTSAPWLLNRLQAAEMVYIDDVSALPPEASRERRILEERPGGRWYAFPIRTNDSLEGFLGCQCYSKPLRRVENEVAVLETVVGMLGSALAKAAILETLEQRVADRTAELDTLYRITSLTSAALPLETTLARSLGVLLRALGSAVGTVHLREDPEAPLILVAHQGLSEEAIDELNSLVPEACWWHQVLASDEPVVLFPDVCVEPQALQQTCLGDVQACLGVRVGDRSHPVGVLSVFSQSGQEFTTEEMALLTTIADQLATAVQNDRLRRHNEEARVAQERQRLSRDLHDAVTQSLYSLTLFAEAARDMCHLGKPDRAQEHLERIIQTSHQALKEMRLLIYQLRPAALQHEGLVAALQRRLDAVERRAGFDAQLIDDTSDARLPPPVEEALYRIAQELLNNILKHARATATAVELCADEQWVELTIRDNGHGFDPAASSASGGAGLTNINDRVAALDGAVTIDSVAGEGTEVRVRIPIPERAKSMPEVRG